MNGAESLLRTLVGSGVEVCFGNPGTSEMHFVGSLDKVEGMRAMLCLFEGAVTGAADGYGRMAEKPAATLLHLGPGLANGLANLHNARRASTPIVNIVGDHATYHAACVGRPGICPAGLRLGAFVGERTYCRSRRSTSRAGSAAISWTDRDVDPARRHGLA